MNNISFWDYANSHPIASFAIVVVVMSYTYNVIKELAWAIALSKSEKDETDSKV